MRVELVTDREDLMRRTGLLWVAVAALGVIISSCSEREGTRQPSGVGTGGAGANLSDDEFVRDVALKNLVAVELSRIALDKATHPDIKSFAQVMIDDHGAAGQSLKSIVSGQPIEWPMQVDEKHRKTADELTRKHGPTFDVEYVKAMVEGHQDLAAKLESRLDVQSLADWKTAAAARTDSKAMPEPRISLRDVQVRPNKSDNEVTMKINQWAADTYPVAQKHLDTARGLETATKRRSTN
jgi:predicted outer membrane protein